jgi:hypothetical protein
MVYIPKRFEVKRSTRKNKKYDVYENGNYLLSFGERRKAFWKRHKPTDDRNSARYWARFLW